MMSAQEDNDILMDNELIVNNPNSSAATANNSSGPTIFPLARVKKIMKADKDVNLVSADAVNLVSLATELFLDNFVKRASDISQNDKRRTILYKDFASAVKQDIRYSFLQELVPETVSIQAALEAQKHHGMIPSNTPNHSPVLENDDHFESFKSSSSNVGSSRTSSHSINSNSIQQKQQQQQGSSLKSSKSDFFAKRTPGNVNYLLNSNGEMNIGMNDESIDITDDTH